MQQDLLYQIALTRVPGIGCVHAKILVEQLGSAEQIFKTSVSRLERIEGIGSIRARQIHSFKRYEEIEKEIGFVEKFGIRTFFLNDADYPRRLLNCYDPPTLLYFKGTAELNASRVVGVIGTRNYTEYGRYLTQKLVESLAAHQVTIISGLAFGIDALAHQSSLKYNIPTVGVLAHGLDRIYPSEHHAMARDMVNSGGGLLTEFPAGTKPDRHHFPTRNRIVAGLCDCMVVIESGIKGGSMLTANLANGYHRDVFAFPARITDSKSAGCLQLINQNQAHLLQDTRQLLTVMGWEESVASPKPVQKKIFEELDEFEQKIVALLDNENEKHIDEISHRAGMPGSLISSSLLNLELKNIVRSLPGKKYQLI